MKLKRIKTINNIDMIQCGDYNWEVLHENDGSEVYRLTIGTISDDKQITLFYGKNTLSIRSFDTTYTGEGDSFFFKMLFEQTPLFVKSLIDGQGGLELYPIYHKDTVKIKNQ